MKRFYRPRLPMWLSFHGGPKKALFALHVVCRKEAHIPDRAWQMLNSCETAVAALLVSTRHHQSTDCLVRMLSAHSSSCSSLNGWMVLRTSISNYEKVSTSQRQGKSPWSPGRSRYDLSTSVYAVHLASSRIRFCQS